MSARIYTAAEAQALLDAANDFTAVDPGSYCGGSQTACALDGECHGDHPSGRLSALLIDAGEEDETLYFAEEADCALVAAAPDLARTIIAQAEKIAELNDVIDRAAGNLDGEHLASCDRWASICARCNCVVGRAHALLAKAVTS